MVPEGGSGVEQCPPPPRTLSDRLAQTGSLRERQDFPLEQGDVVNILDSYYE